MGIKSHDSMGFIVTVKTPNGNYADFEFMYRTQGLHPLDAWAIRNGYSQAMTDCIAGAKSQDVAEKKLAAKYAAFQRGEVPREGGIGKSFTNAFERELHAVTLLLLRKLGAKVSEAETLIEKDEAIQWIAARANQAGEVIEAELRAKAQRRVDDMDILPGVA